MSRIIRAAAAWLMLACLLLVIVPESALAAEKLSDIVDVNNYPTAIDETLSCDNAFAQANKLYAKGSYKKATSYYLLALKKISSSRIYTEGDVCNNLVLTLLHRKKNKTAYRLCRYMLEAKLAKTTQDRYGYMLNMLVCAHARGIPAAKELRLALEKKYFSFSDLSNMATSNPGTYSKLLSGMVYNVLYMDMEGDAYDGAASYYYLPSGRFGSITKKDVMKKLADLTAGKEKPKSTKARKNVTSQITAKEYLQYIRDVLNEANRWNRNTFNQADPDIAELLTYVDALMAQIK